ncbi:hypothetical protein QM012_003223 [Aureobasidium pullulans]|uniref:Uncharacterized protein n=1 Tax=Aureobasidium pullulans TaxID=5580 RepID=A0ABR0T9M1_AURPU
MELHGLDKADFDAIMREPVSSPEKTSKRQVLKSFASKLKRSTSRRGSTSERSLNRRKSQLLDVPSVVLESEPNILAEWGSKRSSDLPRPSKDSVVGQYYVGNIVKPSHKSPRSSPKQLGHDELVNYFAGAPVFEIRSLRPRVSYRWKLDEESGEPQDFVDVGHSTFEAATLRRRERTRQLRDLVAEDADNQIPMMEVPNMLSLNGNEPGTIGLEHFLQMPLADSKRCAEDEDEAFRSKRQLLATSPERLELRSLDIQYLIQRLGEIGSSRHSRSNDEQRNLKRDEQSIANLHTELFSNLLTEPEREEDESPYTSLEGQVVALARVLVTTKLWYDFSLVEHRIRLGQILWPSTEYDEESVVDADGATTPSERDILLLQIALACELLIRVELSGFPTSGFSRKLRWDLVLAQRFLDNVQIALKETVDDAVPCRNSVMSIATFVTAKENLEESRVEPIMYPRHEKRQVAGLLKFADALAWPHAEEIQNRFAERVKRHSRDAGRYGVYGAPLGTPNQTPSQSNYFAQQKRPQVSRTCTAQSLQLLPASAYGPDTFDLGGWLSRSWLTGFVLPGESTSHLLISTLLENSPAAVAALGDAANLYQGFIYKSRSYWSKSCVVGRVIAAANGAADCMGWISCSSAPVNQQDGWVNLEVKDLPGSIAPPNTNLAADSAFVPGEKTSVTDVEFTWPVDGFAVLGNEARYLGFSLLPTGTSFELSAAPSNDLSDDSGTHLAPVPTAVACLEFGTKRSSRPAKVTLPLLYDVHFISATPCFPNISRPSSPVAKTSSTKSRSRSNTEGLSNKELPSPPTHPLHCSYAVEVIPAATILADDFTDTVHLGNETVVLDCRGTGELQLLARAWCAKVGENAVVGRVGKTCLGCCVREASGLGVKVVVRI